MSPPTKTCYLVMLNLDSQGNMRILFPNEYYKNNFVKACRVIKIPDEKNDSIVCISTTAAFNF